MRKHLALILGLGGAFFVALGPTPARADDGGTPHGVGPLAAPPAPSQVPVPDVRGMGEADAGRTLREAGLRLGGVERVSVERLEAELGQRYVLGTVVQQAPRPSTGEDPSWLTRGSPVWLRMAAARDEGVIRPRVPLSPQPAPRYAQPAAPLGRMPRYAGNAPVPPPPTMAGPSVQRQALPRTPAPYVPQPPVLQQPPPYAPQPPVVEQPPPVVAPQPEYVQPLPTDVAPYAAPQETDTYFGADIRSRVALPCERRLERWHVRPVGGAAFWLGDDKGDVGLYAGADIGYSFANCFGVDVFYRYAAGTFDRALVSGLLEDGGSFQFVGLKGTYNASFGSDGRLYFFAGLGAAYYWTGGLQVSDDGVAGFGEIGLGYAVSDAIRLRLGLNLHALDTKSGRFDPAGDGSSRLLWVLAPTLGLELDL